MRLSIFTILFVILIVGCRKDVAPIIIDEATEGKSPWEKFDKFYSYQNIVLNSHSSNDTLIFSTASSTSYYFNNNIFHYYSSTNIDMKLPITDKYHIENFSNTAYKLQSHSPMYSKILNFDTISNFIDIGFPFSNATYSRLISFNEQQNQVVFSICRDTNLHLAKFYDFKIVNFHFDGGIIIDSVVNSRISSVNYAVYCTSIESFYNKYFVGTDNGFYIIYADGTNRLLFEGLNNRVVKVFKLNNKLYAVSDFKIFESLDEGENWILKYQSGNYLSNVLYYTLNDSTLLYTTSTKIYRMFLDQTTFYSKEVETNVFPNYSITSFSEFKDSVYVTTLSGVYRRLKKDFYSYDE